MHAEFVLVMIIKAVFPRGLMVKNCLPVQELQVLSLGQEDPVEREMTTHSSILA